ncbi:MAG: EAL domain-containing protein [Leptospiraceae bacterium]|nr:EAL domain-containing protein [Leptospiraceae bacterium]
MAQILSSYREIAPFMRSLLIDGQGNFRTVLRTQLANVFMDLETCTSDKDIANTLKKESYNVVFIDSYSPASNPFDLPEVVRSYQPDSVIILLVDEDDIQSLKKGARSDIDGFLVRPFTRIDIRHILRKVMNVQLSSRRFDEYRLELNKNLGPSVNLAGAKESEKTSFYRDPLTGLYNRLSLLEDIEKPGEKALVLLNLDNFSQINLGYGFQFGDEILKAVGNYLLTMAPSNARTYRLPGDEFAIILNNPLPDQEAMLSSMLHSEVPRLNLMVLEIGVKIGCSIGYVRSSDKDIYRYANIALLESRSRGKGRVQQFSFELNFERKQKENIVWINRLKNAFEEGRIQPWYQPIMENATRQVRKFESLIRMLTRRGDVISPANFLKPAEMAGLLPLITGAVVEATLPLAKRHNLSFSINISDQDFRGLFLVDYLERKIEELELDPALITLEILEDPGSGFPEETAEQIRVLRNMGFKIALDDFGVSGSNFSRLNDYHPDYIKIDGRFVRGVASNKDNQRIVNMIQQLAHGIGAKTIAEFVANEQDFNFLIDLGVDYTQGHYVGAAAPFSIKDLNLA